MKTINLEVSEEELNLLIYGLDCRISSIQKTLDYSQKYQGPAYFSRDMELGAEISTIEKFKNKLQVLKFKF